MVGPPASDRQNTFIVILVTVYLICVKAFKYTMPFKLDHNPVI